MAISLKHLFLAVALFSIALVMGACSSEPQVDQAQMSGAESSSQPTNDDLTQDISGVEEEQQELSAEEMNDLDSGFNDVENI